MASPEAIEDYYAILEIPVYATASSIRDAYRKLALKYHPDKNRTESATSDFQRLGRAWDILQDPAKRAAYDKEYVKLLKRKREKEEECYEGLRAKRRREEVDREATAQWPREAAFSSSKPRKKQDLTPEEISKLDACRKWKLGARIAYLERLRTWTLFREERLRRLRECEHEFRIQLVNLRYGEDLKVSDKTAMEIYDEAVRQLKVAGIDIRDYLAKHFGRLSQKTVTSVARLDALRDLRQQHNKLIEELNANDREYQAEESSARKANIQNALELLGPRDLGTLFEVINRRSQAINHWKTLSRVSPVVKTSTAIGTCPAGPWHEAGEWKRIPGDYPCGRCGLAAFHIVLDCGPAKCPGCRMTVCNACHRDLSILRQYGDWLSDESPAAKTCLFSLEWDIED